MESLHLCVVGQFDDSRPEGTIADHPTAMALARFVLDKDQLSGWKLPALTAAHFNTEPLRSELSRPSLPPAHRVPRLHRDHRLHPHDQRSAAVAARMSPLGGIRNAPFQRAAATASLAGPRSLPLVGRKRPLSTLRSDDEHVWQRSQKYFWVSRPAGMTAPRY